MTKDFLFLLSFFFLLSPCSHAQEEVVENGLKYELNATDHTATLMYPVSQSISGSVTVPATVTKDGVTYNVTTLGKQKDELTYGGFYNCTSLTSITLPEGMTKVAPVAFRKCTSLTSVSLPTSLTDIGIQAFNRCTSLTSITLPEGLSHICKQAFMNCTNLTSVTLPKSLTKIDDNVFAECTESFTLSIPECLLNTLEVPITDDISGLIEIPFRWQNGFTGFYNLLVLCEDVPTEDEREEWIEKLFIYSKLSGNKLIQKRLANNFRFQVPASEWSVPTATPSSGTSVRGESKVTFAGVASTIGVECRVKVGEGEWSAWSAATDDSYRLPAATEAAQSITVEARPAWPISVEDVTAQSLNYTIIGEVTVDGLTYTLDPSQHTATLVGGTPTNGRALVPAQVSTSQGEQYTVTAIAPEAFWDNGAISSLELPASVTSIGPDAFRKSNLTTVRLPEASRATLQIGANAFDEVSFEVECEDVPTAAEQTAWKSLVGNRATKFLVPQFEWNVSPASESKVLGSSELTLATATKGLAVEYSVTVDDGAPGAWTVAPGGKLSLPATTEAPQRVLVTARAAAPDDMPDVVVNDAGEDLQLKYTVLGELTADGLTYQLDISDEEARTATVISGTPTEGSVAVPGSVSTGGEEYTVAAIGPEAFRNTTLASLSLSEETLAGLQIGADAFTDCAEGLGFEVQCEDVPTTAEQSAWAGKVGDKPMKFLVPAIAWGASPASGAALRGGSGVSLTPVEDGLVVEYRLKVDEGEYGPWTVASDGALALPPATEAAQSVAVQVRAAEPIVDSEGDPLEVSYTIIGELTSEGLTYTLDETDGVRTATVVSGTPTGGAVTVPGSVRTAAGTEYTVTAIGREAFWDQPALVSVTLPASVTSLGEGAFRKSSLQTVTLPEASLTELEIGARAFESCEGVGFEVQCADVPTAAEQTAMTGKVVDKPMKFLVPALAWSASPASESTVAGGSEVSLTPAQDGLVVEYRQKVGEGDYGTWTAAAGGKVTLPAATTAAQSVTIEVRAAEPIIDPAGNKTFVYTVAAQSALRAVKEQGTGNKEHSVTYDLSGRPVREGRRGIGIQNGHLIREK